MKTRIAHMWDLFSVAIRVAGLSQPLSERPDYNQTAQQDKTGIIRHVKGKGYCVKSEKNNDWSGGCYPTKGEAEARLKDVEMFKHMKKK